MFFVCCTLVLVLVLRLLHMVTCLLGEVLRGGGGPDGKRPQGPTYTAQNLDTRDTNNRTLTFIRRAHMREQNPSVTECNTSIRMVYIVLYNWLYTARHIVT